ncbi:MAG TPA: NAD(P)H-hydrate dehydratase [Candidatus Dormibacteraeota bacterium]|nr:NAD(P)H-hydrate dehydratase [Candidatus Dormibacteraeota bacterium]
MKILTAAETREVDRLTTERAGTPSLTLMENAGRGVADFIRSQLPLLARREILVLCGKGNNGGDGFVVARHLQEMGAKPVVYFFASPQEAKGEAATNLALWRETVGKFIAVPDEAALDSANLDFSERAIIVDALLGTGVRGSVEGLLRSVIEKISARQASVPVISVDIPSGLDADTGEICGVAVHADYTVTFTAPKLGFFYGAAAEYQGQLVVREIGSPPELIEEVGGGRLRWSEASEFARFAIPRKPEGYKGDYGHALVIAGSVGKTGAAVLASWATLRAGAGLVTVATAEPALPLVAQHTPEVMTSPLPATVAGTISERSLEGSAFAALLAGKRALAIGPGLTTNPETQSFVRRIVTGSREVPIILDADGLNAFAGRAMDLKHPDGRLAITPHPGEMARLLGSSIAQVQKDRVDVALKAASDWNAYVILKGHHTVVASPGGQAYINSTGNPGMGTGGTGDALTGMLAAMTAQFGVTDWHRVLAFGVYLHGLAGDVAFEQTGGAPLMASDLIKSIPGAYQEFFSESDRA